MLTSSLNASRSQQSGQNDHVDVLAERLALSAVRSEEVQRLYRVGAAGRPRAAPTPVSPLGVDAGGNPPT
jgi:hypothetical protein